MFVDVVKNMRDDGIGVLAGIGDDSECDNRSIPVIKEIDLCNRNVEASLSSSK